MIFFKYISLPSQLGKTFNKIITPTILMPHPTLSTTDQPPFNSTLLTLKLVFIFLIFAETLFAGLLPAKVKPS